MSEAFVGRLVAIYTTADAGAPMVARSEIAAEAGVGLAGDRYATRTGSFSGRPGARPGGDAGRAWRPSWP